LAGVVEVIFSWAGLKMRSVLLCLLAVLWGGMLAGCEETVNVAPEPPTTITIAGATSMRPLLIELTEQFSRQHPSVVFDLRGGGSALGEAQVANDLVSLAASTLQPVQEVVTSDASGAADGLRRTLIGLDGLAIILHPSTRVENLTLLQLADIFSGRILNWRAVGGGEQEIQLVSREEGSGARRSFEDRVMGDRPVSLTAVVMPTSADVVDYVASHPGAIGYVSRAYVTDLLDPARVEAEATPVARVRVSAVEGLLPTVDALRSQSYFLLQPLYLIGAADPQPRVRQFLDFVLGPAGQEIVARLHAPLR
jgi:phosphate transport system substrate-binding protein